MNPTPGESLVMNSPESYSRRQAWLLAIRPRTLGAGVIPVLVGLAVASRSVSVDAATALATALCASFLQITSNLANDYYDFVRGVDDEDRLGPLRVTQAGLLAPRSVLAATRASLAAALICGAWLIVVGGPAILAIGVAAAVCALASSAGPRPLSWYGLGDPLAFLFFGVVAVLGTVLLQGAGIGMVAVLASVPIGCLVTALIVVNNLRDIDSDTRAGKGTLAVRIGEAATRREYTALILAAYLLLIPLALASSAAGALLPLLSAPLALGELRAIAARGGSALNLSLVGTARLHVVFGVLLGAGLWL